MTDHLPGTQVLVRGLRWEVVHTEPAGPEQLRYRLRCLDGALRGEEVDFLSALDPVTPIAHELDPLHPARLRGWQLYHDAFLLEQALGPHALLAVEPGRLDIAPYQLVPVMRALAMSRPRLLLADGVGLGKTIQAGLVMAELIARRRAHRILIVTPAGPLLEQWSREMRERFGLRFQAITSWGELQELRRTLVLGANPFDHLPFCLLSLDFAKQDKVLQDLDRAAWDLVVIDEAHHCVKLSGDNTEDTRRRHLAEALAKQSDGLLLLTATPHDGYDPHFASLVELLDPSLLDGRGTLLGDKYRHHVVRRLKDHIKDPRTGAPLFRTRIVEPRPVTFTDGAHTAFADLQLALMAMIAPRLKRALKAKSYGEVLAFVSLLKRSVSTVAACKSTLAVIRDRYLDELAKGAGRAEARKQRIKTLDALRRRMERYGTLSVDEEQDLAALEAEEMAADLAETGLEALAERLAELRQSHANERRKERPKERDKSDTRAALDDLIDLAGRALGEDPKLAAILREVQAIRASEPAANILIYSEYTDSQKALVDHLTSARARDLITGDILQISGEDPDKVRGAITDRFRKNDDLIIVSTDATAEGLNLHDRCHHLLHVELPYNPNRLEQRNGRIDRYGQKHDPIVRYLYLCGTFEERLLLRLVAKFERQRARLTFVPNTLGGITSDEASTVRLLEGLTESEPHLFESARPLHRLDDAASHDDLASPAFRDLLAEVERAVSSFDKLAKTHTWLGDAGLNADAKHLAAAAAAREQGRHLGAIGLLDFVTAAIEVEARAPVVDRRPDGIVAIQLTPDWTHGLTEIPGYDPNARTILLSADPSLTKTRDGHEVGYLGRAHPLVRRALDRVRNLRFGDADAQADRRVSAVHLDVPAPQLLLTYLGVVKSAAGHEFERVLAVRVAEHSAPQVLVDPSAWEPLIRAAPQANLSALWPRHFAAWAPSRQTEAERAAALAFEQLAEPFIREHDAQIESEREDHRRWLRARATDLCGPVEVEQQAALFDDAATAPPPLPSYKTLRDPLTRLTALAAEPTARALLRRDAKLIVEIYSRRLQALDAHAKPRADSPVPLGLLMILPSAKAVS